MNGYSNPQETKPGPSSPSSSNPARNDHLAAEEWGTQVMGTPAVPTSHPNNQKAYTWSAGDHPEFNPYVQYGPVQRPAMAVLRLKNWGNKVETTANNIWHNLKTGPNVPEAAWRKMNLNAKAFIEGGFEPLYKQRFATFASEELKKTFACYLTTSTGPVAGTLFLSNIHVAFCSDRPFAPSGQLTWSYYKVMVPLWKVATVKPVLMNKNKSEKYIHIVTADGHDLWFMGFVNFEKASHHLLESVAAAEIPIHS